MHPENSTTNPIETMTQRKSSPSATTATEPTSPLTSPIPITRTLNKNQTVPRRIQRNLSSSFEASVTSDSSSPPSSELPTEPLEVAEAAPITDDTQDHPKSPSQISPYMELEDPSLDPLSELNIPTFDQEEEDLQGEEYEDEELYDEEDEETDESPACSDISSDSDDEPSQSRHKRRRDAKWNWDRDRVDVGWRWNWLELQLHEIHHQMEDLERKKNAPEPEVLKTTPPATPVMRKKPGRKPAIPQDPSAIPQNSKHDTPISANTRSRSHPLFPKAGSSNGLHKRKNSPSTDDFVCMSDSDPEYENPYKKTRRGSLTAMSPRSTRRTGEVVPAPATPSTPNLRASKKGLRSREPLESLVVPCENAVIAPKPSVEIITPVCKIVEDPFRIMEEDKIEQEEHKDNESSDEDTSDEYYMERHWCRELLEKKALLVIDKKLPTAPEDLPFEFFLQGHDWLSGKTPKPANPKKLAKIKEEARQLRQNYLEKAKPFDWYEQGLLVAEIEALRLKEREEPKRPGRKKKYIDYSLDNLRSSVSEQYKRRKNRAQGDDSIVDIEDMDDFYSEEDADEEYLFDEDSKNFFLWEIDPSRAPATDRNILYLRKAQGKAETERAVDTLTRSSFSLSESTEIGLSFEDRAILESHEQSPPHSPVSSTGKDSAVPLESSKEKSGTSTMSSSTLFSPLPEGVRRLPSSPSRDNLEPIVNSNPAQDACSIELSASSSVCSMPNSSPSSSPRLNEEANFAEKTSEEQRLEENFEKGREDHQISKTKTESMSNELIQTSVK